MAGIIDSLDLPTLEWIDMLIEKDVDSLLMDGHTFQDFNDSSITLLGGTGFIGKWLIEALHVYARNYSFSPKITVITRYPKNAHKIFVEDLGFKLKIIEFNFAINSTDLGKSDFFINGATPSQNKTGLLDNHSVYKSSVNASHSLIRSATKFRNRPKVVNLSSGIVYGPQDVSVRNQTEGPIAKEQPSQSGYLDAKIASELLLSEASDTGLVESISPRLYAFAGPGIVLDEHFAVGNFIRDGLQGNQIIIKGNPSTMRSYMYPTDLVIWILTALLKPTNLDTNIGSEVPISMLQLGNLISDMTSKKGVQILGENQEISNYVPSTSSFRENYGVSQQITLSSGLERWIEWLLKSKIT